MALALDDADCVAVVLENFVNTFPAGTVHEATVHEHDARSIGCRHLRLRVESPIPHD
jgi:hypothetical protein